MASLTERMIGAAKLEVATYEEVEQDPNAMGQAMLVVVASSVAAGIGSIRAVGMGGLIFTTIAAIVGWFVWAALTYWIGTKLLPEPQTHADFGQLLRTIGFSAAPGVLRILGIIPILGWLVSVLAGLWMLVAMVIAVRQALDYKSTGRAIGVCLIGFVVYVVISTLLVMMGMPFMRLAG
jgi:hypothetical protein